MIKYLTTLTKVAKKHFLPTANLISFSENYFYVVNVLTRGFIYQYIADPEAARGWARNIESLLAILVKNSGVPGGSSGGLT